MTSSPTSKRVELGAPTLGGAARARAAIALRAPTGMLPAVHAEIVAHVEQVRKAGLLPSHLNTPEKAIVAILKGRELGMQPMQSLASIYVVKGLATLKTEAMLALAFQRIPDLIVEVEKSDDEEAVVLIRRGRSSFRSRFSKADATRAGLWGKDAWKSWPRDMLRWRAIAPGLRILAPDVLQGTYAFEEVDGDGAPDVVAVKPDVAPVAEPERPERRVVEAGPSPGEASAEPAEKPEPPPAEAHEPAAKPPTATEPAAAKPRSASAEKVRAALRALIDAVTEAGLHSTERSPEAAAGRHFQTVVGYPAGAKARAAMDGTASEAEVAALLADLGRATSAAQKSKLAGREPGSDDLPIS